MKTTRVVWNSNCTIVAAGNASGFTRAVELFEYERRGDHAAGMNSLYDRLLDAAEGERPMPVAVAASVLMTDAISQAYPRDVAARLRRFWNLMGRMRKRLLEP